MVMPNDDNIKDEIIIDDDDSLASAIDPSKTKFWKLKEWKIKIKEGKQKEWTWKIKEWARMSYLLSKKGITHGILPPQTTMTEYPIGAPWDGET